MSHPLWVLPYRDLPFPLQEVRDLRGILRAMYREQRDRGADAETLSTIEAAGAQLKKALDLHREFGARPRTMGARASWKAAEDGALAADRLVDQLYAKVVGPIVKATAKRISGLPLSRKCPRRSSRNRRKGHRQREWSSPAGGVRFVPRIIEIQKEQLMDICTGFTASGVIPHHMPSPAIIDVSVLFMDDVTDRTDPHHRPPRQDMRDHLRRTMGHISHTWGINSGPPIEEGECVVTSEGAALVLSIEESLQAWVLMADTRRVEKRWLGYVPSAFVHRPAPPAQFAAFQTVFLRLPRASFELLLPNLFEGFTDILTWITEAQILVNCA